MIDDRVKVIGPLAEYYECKTAVVRSIRTVNGLKRYQVEFDNKDTDDFFATELRFIDL